MGFLARTPISTEPTGPTTVPQGPFGLVARVTAGADGPVSGVARWALASARSASGAILRQSSSSSPPARCAWDQPTASGVTAGVLGVTCASGVTVAAHQAWARLQEAEAREARRRRAERERERAEQRADRRAAQRAAKRKAARERAEKRARERAEKRAAKQRAQERRKRKRQAEKRAARRAAEAARRRARSGGSGWRTSPIVTWYGPGFYGNRTACGVRYTRRIVGVAHRTLPCGTLVEFKWHGITAVAPVIDRGPFASSKYVFDFSAAMACEVFKPRGVDNACFTRYDVKYRVVGKVNLKRYLRDQ